MTAMVDLSLASFTMKTDCRLMRVARSTASRGELHTCAPCHATLIVEPGKAPVCPVRRLVAWQRSQISNQPANQP